MPSTFDPAAPTSEASALGPIDPASVIREGDESDEKEKAAPWIVRKLVGSITGRIVMSSYESLRATGTSVICLSPWGDANPMSLPCIRFRDIAVHTIIAATGGMAAVAAPVMGPVVDSAVSTFGDTILVEMGLHAGFSLTTAAANDLIIDHPINHAIPLHSKRLETKAVKVLLITLKYHHTVEDAALGFFRSSVHTDQSLFAAVQDYLAVEKGWFSPYLFASGRRPIIPRNMKPDIIFCHGPFTTGDYDIGSTLLKESAMVISFCKPPPPSSETMPPTEKGKSSSHPSLSVADIKDTLHKIPSISNMFSRSREPSPEPTLTPIPAPPTPRRIVILLVGIKPHRTLWTTSARPSESVINYILFDGCPTIIAPAKIGAPLLAWDSFTLAELWKLDLPTESSEAREKSTDDLMVEDGSPGFKFEGVIRVLSEYLGLCVDWSRVVLDGEDRSVDEERAKAALKDALRLLLSAAVQSKNSGKVKKEVDQDRSGIAMWRIP